MKIRVYTTAWNEEQILPHFLRFYARFAERIVVYDNGSDDATPAIVRAHPQAELRSYDTGGTLHDGVKADLLSHCYREVRGQADWVVAVDCDEFLYHPELVERLARYAAEGVTLPPRAGLLDGHRRPGPRHRRLRGLAERPLRAGRPERELRQALRLRPRRRHPLRRGAAPLPPGGPPLALANDSNFGLSASVWSRDKVGAMNIARRVEAGAVCVNDHMIHSR